MSFFYDNVFHFLNYLIKQKLKIGSNVFLIWFFKHSCVLKKMCYDYYGFKWPKKKI
jgi:hypothetical protein